MTSTFGVRCDLCQREQPRIRVSSTRFAIPDGWKDHSSDVPLPNADIHHCDRPACLEQCTLC